MKNRTLRAILLSSLFLAGTAVQASPQDDLAAGQAAVINALVAGAEAHAPQWLDRARRSLQLARDCVVRNEFDRARQLSGQAIADAMTAESRAAAVREALLAPGAQVATR